MMYKPSVSVRSYVDARAVAEIYQFLRKTSEPQTVSGIVAFAVHKLAEILTSAGKVKQITTTEEALELLWSSNLRIDSRRMEKAERSLELESAIREEVVKALKKAGAGAPKEKK